MECHDPVSGNRVPTEHCTGKAPSTSTKCYAQSGIWAANSCGSGTKAVNVKCMDPTRRFVLSESRCYDKHQQPTGGAFELQNSSEPDL